MNAILWLSKLLFVAFFAEIHLLVHLELCGVLALDHVSLKHILAVVCFATEGAFKGPTFHGYKYQLQVKV